MFAAAWLFPIRYAAVVLVLILAAICAPGEPAAQDDKQGDFFRGYEAYERGEYDKARNLWLPLALKGDVDAQFNLGALYDNGFGVDKSSTKAAQWYSAAAGRKLAIAQVTLARMRRAGEIETIDWEESVGLLETAAHSGFADAQYELGVAFDRGIGVTQNYATAALWYRRAADQKLAAAQYNLATLHDEGQGTPRDLERAVELYRLAAGGGNTRAMNNLGYMYEKGRGLRQDYKQAAFWYGQAADLGLAVAQNNLAVLYHMGHGVERDYVAAARWYRASATAGDPIGQNNLGLLFANGLGVERDLVEGVKWFSLAERGNSLVSARARNNKERLLGLLPPEERARAEHIANMALAQVEQLAAVEKERQAPLPLPADAFEDLSIRVQRLLANLGFYHDVIDGISGPITFQAIEDFIRESGLRLPVRISEDLVVALERSRAAQ